ECVGLDAFPQAVTFSRQRGVDVVTGSLPDDVPLEAGRFDAVLLLDVLEHLDDDYGGLKRAVRLLRPGGIAICTVPAYPWLWTARDEHHQHKRRYTSGGFRRLMMSTDARMLFI